MAFGVFDRSDDAPMAEINTTPLVDVMLVLLVIFMVTAPLFTHAVRIDLPRAQSQPTLEQPDTVVISIDALGAMRWNGEPIERPGLAARLAQAAVGAPEAQVHVRAHRDTRYQIIAELLSEAQRSGIRHIGLVTDPSSDTGARR